MKGYKTRRFAGIPVGFHIRRDIGKVWTYRVNRGNGFYGTKLGEMIQLRYPYNVSDPICDHTGIANKNDFADAVTIWHTFPDVTKKWWDDEVKRLHLCMSGFNLYISRYRLGKL